MIVVLMIGWLLAGLVLASLVGRAVRIAEVRGDWGAPAPQHEAETARAA